MSVTLHLINDDLHKLKKMYVVTASYVEEFYRF